MARPLAQQAAEEQAAERSRLESLAYALTAAGAVLLLLALALWPRQAPAAELFASAGPARYQPCGGAGCWQQSPLPFQFYPDTSATALGVRAGAWQLALRDLGSVAVHGIYVPDADYDPQALQVRDGARQWRGMVQQSTLGASVMYAPRWERGRLSLDAGAGVLLYRQRTSFALDWLDGACCSTHFAQDRFGATPIAGAAIGWRVSDRLAVAYELTAAWRVKQGDAPMGGGASNRPGVVWQALSLRWVL
jgi:hypothetical protein